MIELADHISCLTCHLYNLKTIPCFASLANKHWIGIESNLLKVQFVPKNLL